MCQRVSAPKSHSPPLASFPSADVPGPSATVRPQRSRREAGVRVRTLASKYPRQGTQKHTRGAANRASSLPDLPPLLPLPGAEAPPPPYIPLWHQASFCAGATSRLGGSKGERSPRHSRTRKHTHAQKEYPEEVNTERSPKSWRWGGGGQERRTSSGPPKMLSSLRLWRSCALAGSRCEPGGRREGRRERAKEGVKGEGKLPLPRYTRAPPSGRQGK